MIKLWHKIMDRVKHKFDHFRPSILMDTLVEHGIALVIIIIVWEIIEDILFPVLFLWLGNNVNPAFIVGAPVSWLLCLHPIVVPITWGLWIKIKGKGK